jgi:homoserine dehydrogenase
MRPKIVLVGLGNVGREFVRLLSAKASFLEESCGVAPLLTGVITRTRGALCNPRGLAETSILSWHKSKSYTPGEGEKVFPGGATEDLIHMLDYDILVECTRNDYERGQPGAGYMEKALSKGAHVVTTNRGAVAYYYQELREIARRKGRFFLYEGTVLSGIPLFSLRRNSLRGASILSFEGALSGTCNYMLHVISQGASFDEALMEAQRKGYAEPDPCIDIDGLESAIKGMIVAQDFMGADKDVLSRIAIEGIRQVTPSYMETARRKGNCVRLITRIARDSQGCSLRVAPEMIPDNHPLASMEGVTCGALMTTDLHGDLCFTGSGVGGRSTAAAILNDILEIFPEKLRE